jgi:hypothetical protein
MRKLGRSKSESVESHTQRQPGLVGLLEILRAQLEVGCLTYLFLMNTSIEKTPPLCFLLFCTLYLLHSVELLFVHLNTIVLYL